MHREWPSLRLCRVIKPILYNFDILNKWLNTIIIHFNNSSKSQNIQTKILTRKKLVSGITDIEPWYFETFNEANPDVELFIKRDDNTGATLTGNKVRKLEFLLSDALENKADAIITCGMATSNHCRTTALACAKLGLECHLVSIFFDLNFCFDSFQCFEFS